MVVVSKHRYLGTLICTVVATWEEYVNSTNSVFGPQHSTWRIQVSTAQAAAYGRS